MSHPLNSLGVQILDHLEQERKVCEQVRNTATQVRQILFERKSSTIEVEKIHAGLLPQMESIASRRTLLKEKMAYHLRLPSHQVTLTAFAKKCNPSIRRQIEEACDQLRSEAEALNGLLASNNSLAFRMWSLIESVLKELAGDAPTPMTYDHKGFRRAA